ncbi:hypothetical protein FF2_044330 [Malus domestica]
MHGLNRRIDVRSPVVKRVCTIRCDSLLFFVRDMIRSSWSSEAMVAKSSVFEELVVSAIIPRSSVVVVVVVVEVPYFEGNPSFW